MSLSNIIYQLASRSQEVTIEQMVTQADISPEELPVLSALLNKDTLSNWLSSEWVRQLFPPAVLESEWVPPQLPPELGGLLKMS